MTLDTSTINVLLSLSLSVQGWIVYQLFELRAEVRLLKANAKTPPADEPK